jgi:hypothetical protein
MTIPAKTQAVTAQTVEDVLIKGDLAALTSEQRREYYLNVCKSLNLNPLTQPFTYLTLNNRLTLYPNRTASDQLRKNNGISIEIVSQDYRDGVLTVHVRGRDKDGRQDEEIGAVAFDERLRGEARANQTMKAVTKAKRRLTLSMSGLGWPDETEVEDIPASVKAGPPIDQETGEVIEHKPEPPSKAAAALTNIAKHSTEGEPHEIILGDSPDWIWFGQLMIEKARNGSWEQWRKTNTINLARMENEAPKVFMRMQAAINAAEPKQ